MRTVRCAELTAAVRDLAIAAAHDLEPDIVAALEGAVERETSPLARDVLRLLLANADIARKEMIPACQDTGICAVFVFLGREVHLDGDLDAAVQEGVRQGYAEGFLRKSVCDPMTRANTGDNVPAVVHLELVEGDRVRICFLPKGCGSENMSALKMLPPSAGIPGAEDYIVRQVVDAGPNPCPPLLVGVGIGGTFEKAALMAKKVLLRPLGRPAPDPEVAALEQRLLERINASGMGVHGLGGCNTALAVHVETFPTHIASLPVAVNVQCHSHRHKEVLL